MPSKLMKTCMRTRLSLILVNYLKSEAKFIENLSFEEIKEGKFNFGDVNL